MANAVDYRDFQDPEIEVQQTRYCSWCNKDAVMTYIGSFAHRGKTFDEFTCIEPCEKKTGKDGGPTFSYERPQAASE